MESSTLKKLEKLSHVYSYLEPYVVDSNFKESFLDGVSEQMIKDCKETIKKNKDSKDVLAQMLAEWLEITIDNDHTRAMLRAILEKTVECGILMIAQKINNEADSVINLIEDPKNEEK